MHMPKFFKVYFLDYTITLVPFFLPFIPLYPSPLPPLYPPQFMFMGHTYKFFGYSVSYTILNLPMFILYLPFMLLIPCNFHPFSPLPLPIDYPPCDLHFYGSVPILVVCLVCFFFKVHLLIVMSMLSFCCSYFDLFLR